MGFFKKALGIFVEFEEGQDPSKPANSNPNPTTTVKTGGVTQKHSFNQEELDKFGKHFDKLFDQANLTGPDYYEFCKMMETLEAHIPDEKARMSAVFASLSIQGLTKEKLITTATQYKLIVEKDKKEFEGVVNLKAQAEIDSRKKQVDTLEKKIVENSELIQKLTKEISESQVKIGTIKGEIAKEEHKLHSNSSGYQFACEAMLNKINTDIQKLQTTL